MRIAILSNQTRQRTRAHPERQQEGTICPTQPCLNSLYNRLISPNGYVTPRNPQALPFNQLRYYYYQYSTSTNLNLLDHRVLEFEWVEQGLLESVFIADDVGKSYQGVGWWDGMGWDGMSLCLV